MAAAMVSEARELPDDLPFHVGDVIGTGAFARYFLCVPLVNLLVYVSLKTKIVQTYTQ